MEHALRVSSPQREQTVVWDLGNLVVGHVTGFSTKLRSDLWIAGDDASRQQVSDSEVPAAPGLRKRKRRSTAKVLENAADSSARATQFKSPDVEAQLQAQLAQEDLNPIELLNVVHKKHKNDHAPLSILPPAQRLPTPYHGGYTNPHYSQPPAPPQRESSQPTPRPQHESWAIRPASQNGSRLPPTSQPGSRPPAAFTPISTPVSAPISAPTLAPAPAPAPAPAAAPRYESIRSDRATIPVIDSFPKAKQRQIYSVVSGLQGGIDHLEKQLGSLKALLGIPDDDAMDWVVLSKKQFNFGGHQNHDGLDVTESQILPALFVMFVFVSASIEMKTNGCDMKCNISRQST